MSGGQHIRRLACIVSTVMLAAILAVLAVSCGSDEKADDRIGVIVSLPPQAEFVEKVGGEKVKVTIMVPAGVNPHVYEPTPGQMKKVAGAQIYAKVGSGVEFELAWMDKIQAQNTDMLVIDCSRGIDLIWATDAQYVNGEDSRSTRKDPHIWMSPLNARVMVQNIYEGLLQVDPAHGAYYESNRNAYLQDLDQLDSDIRERLSGVTRRVFMAYHPVFGYFAGEYGMTMLAIEAEGKEPTASGIARLVDQAKENDIQVIFISPQFNPQSARVIADEIGGRIVLVDTLAEDYTANLRVFLNELIGALE